jgi:hypothetical protein
MANIQKSCKCSRKRAHPFFVLCCLSHIFFIGCTGSQSRQNEFEYFKLEGLNRLLQPAEFEVGAAYVHHALSETGELASPHERGNGTLDDAARAAWVHLRHAEISGDSSSIVHARALLSTILHLQNPDGLFFNWIDVRGRPALHKDGDVMGFGFTEVRALWAIAVGAEFFANRDRAFAGKLHLAFWRSFVHVDTCLAHF